MKKLLIFALAAMLLTACGQADEKPQETIYRTITAAEAHIPGTIGKADNLVADEIWICGHVLPAGSYAQDYEE